MGTTSSMSACGMGPVATAVGTGVSGVVAHTGTIEEHFNI